MGLGAGIRDPEKTYSGSRGQKGTGSRIRIRNTGIWFVSSQKATYNNDLYSLDRVKTAVRTVPDVIHV
jgi:hypothetical protein